MTTTQHSAPTNNRAITALLNCHDSGVKLYIKNREKLMKVLQTISNVALGVFSLYVDYQLFLPFCFAGVLSGVYVKWASDRLNDKSLHSKHQHDHSEGLHGIQLPPELGVLANIALTVCHIDHHTDFVVPIVGFSTGYQIGKMAMKAFLKI